ncbi:MAG: methyltransferase domain-containing protein [Rhodospirillaceae bacterium]|nr:methyltransferase domain-containing protein [Rhodospirillaceae bacterium]
MADQPKIEIVSTTTQREVERMRALAQGPVLQVGSRQVVLDAGPRRWRSLLADKDFIGLDVEPGENVDRVGDIGGDFAALDAALEGRRFGFIVCQHVLEHVRRPWVAAENIQRLLRPGGRCYVGVPWVQAYHGFPSDYWRFSFPGLAALFDGLVFTDMYYSASDTGLDAAYKVLVDGKVDLPRTPFEIEAHFFQLVFDRQRNLELADFRGGKKLLIARGYMPVLFVNALGEKPA